MFELTEGFLLVRHDGDERADDLVSAQATHASDLEARLRKVREAQSKIMGDVNLTGPGRRARLTEIGRLAVKEIEGLRVDRLSALRTRAERAGAILSDVIRHRLDGDRDPEEVRLIEREIRDRLSSVGEFEAEQMYLEAARSGDTLTVRAIERAPAPFAIVSKDALEEGRHLHARAINPGGYRHLQELEAAVGSMEWNSRAAVARVTTLTGVAPDPLLEEFQSTVSLEGGE